MKKFTTFALKARFRLNHLFTIRMRQKREIERKKELKTNYLKLYVIINIYLLLLKTKNKFKIYLLYVEC